MNSAARDRAIEIIGDLTEAKMFSVVTSADIVDALYEAGLQLIYVHKAGGVDEEAERRLFEAHILKLYPGDKFYRDKNDGHYVSGRVFNGWTDWLARSRLSRGEGRDS